MTALINETAMYKITIEYNISSSSAHELYLCTKIPSETAYRSLSHNLYGTTNVTNGLSLFYQGVINAGTNLHILSNANTSMSSVTVLIEKCIGNLVLQNNTNYLNPPLISPGLFNITTQDAATSKILFQNTDPDNISILPADYSIYQNSNNVMSFTSGVNASWTATKTCQIIMDFSFTLVNQATKFCFIQFYNSTTNTNLLSTTLQELTSAEGQIVYMSGICPITLGDNYGIRCDYQSGTVTTLSV